MKIIFPMEIRFFPIFIPLIKVFLQTGFTMHTLVIEFATIPDIKFRLSFSDVMAY